MFRPDRESSERELKKEVEQVKRSVPSPSAIDNTKEWPPRPSGFADIKPVYEMVNVTLKTSMGDIDMVLDGKRAPYTVGNFVGLAQEDFYDGTIFHRVIPGFVIQGGDPFSKNQLARDMHGKGGPGYTFQNEINELKIVYGVVAMANAGPGTNGSQFFIVTAEKAPHLDGRHTVFGVVGNGMEVVESISKVETDANDNPLEPVVVEDVIIRGNLIPGLTPVESSKE